MDFEINNFNCDTSTKDICNIDSVPVLSKDVHYCDFFTNYMHPNIPCVIKDVIANWEAKDKWLIDNNTINIEYLKNKYGICDVTIYKCDEKYFNSQKTETSKFATFIDQWNHENCKFNYLKDWHLKNTFKNDEFYQVPIYFASDWLNEYLTEKEEDDYRFVYIGRAGTWTPFHSDVFNSFSWSANLCGKKKWILFPPRVENLLKDEMGNLPYDISTIYQNVQHFEIIQNSGDAIFVPSGWFHQVWNLEDTISINHNWINGCNILKMWIAIKDNLKAVKKEIEDCRDMHNFNEHCQIMLKASFGIDFFSFFDFLHYTALKRLKQIELKQKQLLFHGHSIGLNHAIFDLQSIRTVLENFIQHEDVAILFDSHLSKPESLLEEIIQSENRLDLLKQK